MKPCCCYFLISLLNLPLAPLSALTILSALQDQRLHSPLWYYTLISGVLLFVVPLLLSICFCCQYAAYNTLNCRFHKFRQFLVFVTASWGLVSIAMLFSFGNEFLSLSSYRKFTLCSVALFSLPLFPFLFILIKIKFKPKNFYPTILIGFLLLALGSSLWLFFGIKNKFKDYTFFSFNLLAALVGTLAGLIGGY